MTIKKRIMTVLWRVQQAQMVISIVFWSLTLTGVFYPYIRERFLNSLIGPENVALGMILMFSLVIVLIIGFGLIYDRLKFWREQTIVVQERNPFAYGPRMMPTQIILWYAILHPEDREANDLAHDMIMHNLQKPEVWHSYQEIKREVGQTTRPFEIRAEEDMEWNEHGKPYCPRCGANEMKMRPGIWWCAHCFHEVPRSM